MVKEDKPILSLPLRTPVILLLVLQDKGTNPINLSQLQVKCHRLIQPIHKDNLSNIALETEREVYFSPI